MPSARSPPSLRSRLWQTPSTSGYELLSSWLPGAGCEGRNCSLFPGVTSICSTGPSRSKPLCTTLRDNSIVVGPPKTDAGRRTIAIPPHITEDIEAHLAHYVGTGADDLVFTERRGGPLRLYTVERAWRRARQEVGLPQLRLHDLRHTGNTLAAATGASTKELMSRMGHASPQAALIYQHATADRDRAIADALSDMATGAPILSIRQKRDLTRPPLGHVQVTEASESSSKAASQRSDQDFEEYPQRDSNPCRRLERAAHMTFIAL